jgi:hypothetical protein
VRRLDAHLDSHIGRLAEQMTVWHAQQAQSVREFELLGDNLLREFIRLQAQIALLEENLHSALANEPEAIDHSAVARPGRSQAA